MVEESRPNFDDLNRFQWDILFVIEQAAAQGETLHGLGVKNALEEAYEDTEVYHGRLYPSLDTLVEQNLIERSEKDKRTNVYTLTDTGQTWVDTRRSFIADDTQ